MVLRLETRKARQCAIHWSGKVAHPPRNAAFLDGGRYPFFHTVDIKAANPSNRIFADLQRRGLAQGKLESPETR